MSMSLADKLALLRLQNGYSKSDLAARLGVSEADVAAWEAGTATPDLNVLPRLAAFYSITVDALLNSETVPNSAQAPAFTQAPPSAQPQYQQQQSYQQPPYTQQQTQYQQNYSQQQQQSQQAYSQENFEQMKNEAKGFVFSKIFEFADSCVKHASHRATARLMFVFPFPLVIVAAYVLAGVFLHLWHPAWIMFLLIPCYYMFAASLRAKSRKGFFLCQPVPIVIVMLFLMLGFGLGAWHPAWILFLFIPAYYWFVAVFVRGRRHW